MTGLSSERHGESTIFTWVTDIHLDALGRPEATRFCDELDRTRASALLLGGDIANARCLVEWLEFLGSRLRIPIYFVLGNHDFYGGDIATVTAAMGTIQGKNLCHLPHCGPINLSSQVSLVGHGGWGDCRIGDLDNFKILTDYLVIEDLHETIAGEALIEGEIERGRLIQKLNDLGDEAAAQLRPQLIEALENSETVIVLTHVPPFRAACWHDGAPSEDQWLPGFTCNAIGDLLENVAKEYLDTFIHVLCGHTHGSGMVQVLPNLAVHTGFGDYGLIRPGTVTVNGADVVVDRPRP